MKIAIDGPAAAGKGTLTKLLAKKIGATTLNTGKLYRVVAFSIQGENIEEEAIANSANFLQFLEKYGENTEIYSQENSILTSKISAIPQVRANLLQFQRDFASSRNPVILEGRDIGTHILPNADFKFYITATAEERAKRRFEQERENGINANFEEILQAVIQRDNQDQTRTQNPLKPAVDAIIIDTTGISIEESLGRILSFLEIEESTKEESELILNYLIEHASSKLPFTQKPHSIDFNYTIKQNGEIIAGVVAKMFGWGILNISVLFVKEEHRNKNYGTVLLKKVEIEAIKKGGVHANLTTMTFQAKEFYLKNGYTIFGTLEGYPNGHKKYFLKKSLI
jgi:cytidylate kinase